MFDLVINDEHTDRDILLHILKGLHAMALDVTHLTNAVAAQSAALSDVSGKVDQLIAAHTDPAAQAAVDAAASAVGSNTAVVAGLVTKIDAALTAQSPAAAAAAAVG